MFFPVALGYYLKKIHFFGPVDYRLFAKTAINITLPCAVVASFAATDLDKSLLSVTLFALILDVVIAFYAWLTSRSIKDARTRCMDMFCVEGYNMGNFLIPFAQQFMGPAGVAVTALFDAGNSPMCTSGFYTFTTTVVSVDGRRPTAKEILKKLFSSPPFLVYIVMICFVALDITIPDPVAQICGLTGSANAFVSMFMMGLMFEIHFDSRYMRRAAFALTRKYLYGACAALICYYVLPFDLLVRQVLVLICFAPIPSLAAIFTDNVKGDVGLCSFITSCSFIISSVMITALIFLMHVA